MLVVSGGGEERFNCGCILKIKPVAFADELDIGDTRKIKDNTKNFDYTTGQLVILKWEHWEKIRLWPGKMGQESRVQFHEIQLLKAYI